MNQLRDISFQPIADADGRLHQRLMLIEDDLFALSPNLEFQVEMLGGSIPVIIIDNVYSHPDSIREWALGLAYNPPAYPYPGKIADAPKTPSLARFASWALRKANEDYLPLLPPITSDGRKVEAFGHVETDFAIVDVHPHDLLELQRVPHTDSVPIFGLVYLNREDRGGTLFFEQTGPVSASSIGAGYVTSSTSAFKLRGRIQAAFNRMAIYPGFIHHSGEISGDWIRDDRRFEEPRLTQRLLYMP